MNKKAISLISGGLDSALATRLILDQGIEVVGLNFTSPFSSKRERSEGLQAIRTARELGIRLILKEKGPEYIDVIRKPKHGYGKNMNPCIDCRIFMLRKTKEVMAKEDASFVITGEVLGQRPLSQRRPAIELIEKESGLESLILRPLSAKHFIPSKPEIEGVIDRKLLLDLAGRGRTAQFNLVEKYKLSEFGDPGGGCLLTDAMYSKRLRDLLAYDKGFSMLDIDLLNTGRHFRISPDTKLILGRNKGENERLHSLWALPYALVYPIDFPGPLGIIKGELEKEIIAIVANIISHYGKYKAPMITIELNNGSISRHEVERTDKDFEQYKILEVQ
jgi:tRNA-uridine 2-sulfurtransferase